jgi:F-type H+-transporting ATPase subunit gamma
MPSTRDIRRRIRSVKSTSQITRAMQMVASSKMAKAQQAAIHGRPFARLANRLMTNAAGSVGDFSHPLLDRRDVQRRALIVVSTDKGLCGALNANLFREALKYDAATTSYIAVGKKAAQFLARSRRKLVAEFSYHDSPTYSECQAITRSAKKMFADEEVDQVDVLFTRFINTLSQRPEVRMLLPLSEFKPLTAGFGKTDVEPAEDMAKVAEYLFEPDAATVMEALLTYILDFQIAQVLLEAKASEHSARMVAMKNATDNAKQLIKDLTLEYNKMRQASITKELLEISSAQMALG